MECKTCGYRLWNLNTRQCPECGAGFSISQYEFAPCTVQFLCPHCGQRYYGTDEKGLLQPRRFDCVTCGQRVHMEEMALLPHAGLSESQTRSEVNPWLDERYLSGFAGWWRRFWGTVGQGMVSPGRLMDLTPYSFNNAGAGAALRYLLWTLSLFTFFGVGVGSLAMMVIMLGAMVGSGSSGGPPAAAMIGTFGGMCVGWLVIQFILVLAWVVATHVLLKITGGTGGGGSGDWGGGISRPPTDAPGAAGHDGGIARTLHAIAYTSGTNVISAVPCLGPYVGWIGWTWWIVVATIAVARGQNVSGWRAALCVAMPPILPFVALIGWIAWGVTTSVQQAQIYGNMAMGNAQASTMLSYVVDYRQQHGAWPGHAAQMVAPSMIIDYEWVAPGSATDTRQINVDGVTLYDLDALPDADIDRHANAVAAALPADTIAHRLGDYVLTWHGIDPAPGRADPDLWLFVIWPDPAQNPAFTPLATHAITGQATTGHATYPYIEAVEVDGDVQSFPLTAAPHMLQQQNQRRIANQLPPLPSPATVLHGQPATVSNAPKPTPTPTPNSAPAPPAPRP